MTVIRKRTRKAPVRKSKVVARKGKTKKSQRKVLVRKTRKVPVRKIQGRKILVRKTKGKVPVRKTNTKKQTKKPVRKASARKSKTTTKKQTKKPVRKSKAKKQTKTTTRKSKKTTHKASKAKKQTTKKTTEPKKTTTKTTKAKTAKKSEPKTTTAKVTEPKVIKAKTTKAKPTEPKVTEPKVIKAQKPSFAEPEPPKVVPETGNFTMRTPSPSIPLDTFVNKWKGVHQITGPSSVQSFTVHVNGHYKQVILFGDELNMPCSSRVPGQTASLDSFMVDVVNTSKSCVDIFIESYKFNRFNKISNDTMALVAKEQKDLATHKMPEYAGMGKVISAFAGCLSGNECKYPATRFHSINFVRTYYDTDKTALQFDNVLNIPSHIYNKALRETNPETKQKMLSALQVHRLAFIDVGGFMPLFAAIATGDVMQVLTFYDDVYGMFLGHQYFTKTYTEADARHAMYDLPHKEMQGIHSDDIKAQAVKYLYRLYNNVNVRLLRMYAKSTYNFDHAITDAYVKTLIMDTYALPRLLKCIYNYQDSSIIMVYASVLHMQVYARFLDSANPGQRVYPLPDTVGCIYTNLTQQWPNIIENLKIPLATPGVCRIKI